MSQKVLDTLCQTIEGFQEAKETVSGSCYMDDCIDSRDTVEEIVALARQLPIFLKEAGMKICKIYSNCPEALSVVDPVLRAPGVELQDRGIIYEEQRVLGLLYNSERDELTFDVKYKQVQDWKNALGLEEWTKKRSLRVIASHYDPLGLASPISDQTTETAPKDLDHRCWMG